MTEIEWIGFHDGYGIVGYGFRCPECEHLNEFVLTDNDFVNCEMCGGDFKSPGDPNE